MFTKHEEKYFSWKNAFGSSKFIKNGKVCNIIILICKRKKCTSKAQYAGFYQKDGGLT